MLLGTSDIIGPSSVIQRFVNSIGGFARGGAYVAPCNSNFQVCLNFTIF
jgi:hypothetical protein